MAFYIVATDSFLSGWGQASKGRSLYAIKCETEAEGYTVMDNMKARSDFKRVRYCRELPRVRPGDVLTVRDRASAARYFDPGAFRER